MRSDAWDKTEPAPAFGVGVPDGEYVARLLSVTEKQFKNGREGLEWYWEVISKGPENGKVIVQVSGLSTEQNLAFLKRDMKALGVDVSLPWERAFSDLQAKAGTAAVLQVLSKAGFQNVYIRRAAGPEDMENASELGREVPF